MRSGTDVGWLVLDYKRHSSSSRSDLRSLYIKNKTQRIPVPSLLAARLGSKMQAVVKSFIFALLVCSFTSAQECSQEEIRFPYILRSVLDQKYNSGATVRVNCEIGYVGFHKLTCVNGVWIKEAGRECRKRPCGHPGDTPNGDFVLKGEVEFVFGAKVEYTCRPGYVMASRVNVRNCRSQGWDNAVPVCEVVKCPAIQTSGDLIATGNTEEASFDDVIHFECASRQMMLDGPENIHCTERGTWSESIPKCIEIRCKRPTIPHGNINDGKEEYKENEQLKYSCDSKYRPRHGTPKCLRNGWSITPECEEINCLLGPPTPGTSTSPTGKNVFRVGESVEITCSETRWLFGTRETKRNIRCKESGEWERLPVCEEIACDIPNDQHVYYPQSYFGGDRRLGVKKSYWCVSGYHRAARTATCTESGWRPNPLCIEIVCSEPRIENAKQLDNPLQTYKPGARLRYQCLRGSDTFEITCGWEGNWNNIQSCPGPATCPEPRMVITNGFINESQKVENVYIAEGTVQYKCSEGFVFENENIARCTEKGWTYPKCIPKPNVCASFRLQHGLTYYFTKGTDSPRTGIYYSCDADYKTFEYTWWGETSCSPEALDYTPQCIRKNECGRIPNIPHGKLAYDQYREKSSVKVYCDFGYQANTSLITCTKGQWIPPKCERLKGDPYSTPPQVENAVITEYTQEPHQTMVRFQCREHFILKGRDTVYYIRKLWDKTPTCTLSVSACGKPETNINHGIIKDSEEIMEYYTGGDTVEYECFEGFFFENETSARCTDRKWIYPKCDVCGPPPQVKNANIQSYIREPQKEVTYECKEHFELKGKRTIYCRSKGWDRAPTCELSPSSCLKPEEILEGSFKDRQDIKDYYTKEDTVEYECSEGYFFEKESYARCTGRGWTYPKCMKSPCLKPGEIHEGSFKDPQNIKDYYTKEDTVEYECSEGYFFEKESYARCTAQGWTYPKCMTTLDCGRPPQIEDAVQDFKDRYEDGEKAAYACPAYYIKEGDPTCRRGKWTGSGKCWKPCTVDLKAMEDRNLLLKYKYTEKIYSTHGDSIEFSCKYRYSLAKGSVPLRQRCTNGRIDFPACE
ncbi:hypothetical protein AOLI_G00144430 [Acnodon oligacanthus]